MANVILEKNGVNITNIDGARFNYFCSGMLDGVIKGSFSECSLSYKKDSFTIKAGELLICGFRILLEETTFNFNAFPAKRTNYNIIAEIKVLADKDVQFNLLIQDTSVAIVKSAIFKNGDGIYQVKFGTLVMDSNGICSCEKVIETITGGLGGETIATLINNLVDNGILSLGVKDGRIVLRDNDSNWKSSIQHSVVDGVDDEQVVMAASNNRIGWIFARKDVDGNPINPNSIIDWTKLLPDMHIKNGRVAIGGLIPDGKQLDCHLKVPGLIKSTGLHLGKDKGYIILSERLSTDGTMQWISGIQHSVVSNVDDEVTIFSTSRSDIGFGFCHGVDPRSNLDWTSIVFDLLIRDGNVVIGKKLGDNILSDYKLDVNGVINASGLAIEGISIRDYFSAKKAIYEYSTHTDVTLYLRVTGRYLEDRYTKPLTKLTLIAAESIEKTSDFEMSLVFISGGAPTSFVNRAGIHFTGDDTVDGQFIPVASTLYELYIWWNGFNYQGIVRGSIYE